MHNVNPINKVALVARLKRLRTTFDRIATVGASNFERRAANAIADAVAVIEDGEAVPGLMFHDVAEDSGLAWAMVAAADTCEQAVTQLLQYLDSTPESDIVYADTLHAAREIQNSAGSIVRATAKLTKEIKNGKRKHRPDQHVRRSYSAKTKDQQASQRDRGTEGAN